MKFKIKLSSEFSRCKNTVSVNSTFVSQTVLLQFFEFQLHFLKNQNAFSGLDYSTPIRLGWSLWSPDLISFGFGHFSRLSHLRALLLRIKQKSVLKVFLFFPQKQALISCFHN
jgi:hypothetical protein